MLLRDEASCLQTLITLQLSGTQVYLNIGDRCTTHLFIKLINRVQSNDFNSWAVNAFVIS